MSHNIWFRNIQIIILLNIGLIHVTKTHFSPWGVSPLKRVKGPLKEIECTQKVAQGLQKGPETPIYPSAGVRLYGQMSHNICSPNLILYQLECPPYF